MESGGFGDLGILSTIFVDMLVLLVSLNTDLQLTLESFVAKCEAAGMRISTSEFEGRVLCWKRMNYSLHGREDLSEYPGGRVVE